MALNTALHYTAIRPDAATRRLLGGLTRQVHIALGRGFVPQHPANLHVSTGIFAPGDTPFVAGKLDIRSDVGAPYFDIFYRAETGELALALCFPCAQVTAWRQASVNRSPAPPHVTIGKFTPEHTPQDAAGRLAMREELKAGKGIFTGLPALASIVAEAYAEAPFRFDTGYVAPVQAGFPTVPRAPVMRAAQGWSLK